MRMCSLFRHIRQQVSVMVSVLSFDEQLEDQGNRSTGKDDRSSRSTEILIFFCGTGFFLLDPNKTMCIILADITKTCQIFRIILFVLTDGSMTVENWFWQCWSDYIELPLSCKLFKPRTFILKFITHKNGVIKIISLQKESKYFYLRKRQSSEPTYSDEGRKYL